MIGRVSFVIFLGKILANTSANNLNFSFQQNKAIRARNIQENQPIILR